MKTLQLILVALLVPCSIWAQTTSKQSTEFGCSAVGVRSAQALSVLQQSLAAAGGVNVLAQIRDFVATGTITYSWAGKQVTGSAVIRGRGIDQFRLDASLPKGTRSWFVSHGKGELKEVDGTLSPIPYHNLISMSALTFPAMRIMAALEDPNTIISNEPTVLITGEQFYKVCVEPKLANPRLSQSASARYFIDPRNFQIVGMHEQTHPKQNLLQNIPHAVYYSDFRNVNGVSIPFSVVETVYMNRTWSLQLDHIQFNTGLSDADFQF